jgi:copper chaperone
MSALRELTFSIQGMHCEACVNRVKKAVSASLGAQVQEISIGRARVRYDPATTGEKEILEAVRKAGYEPENPVSA